MSDTDDDTRAAPAIRDLVATLVAAGDHVAAARLAAQNDDLPRAISLFEQAWRFADALPLAVKLGDRPLAIRLALDAGDVPAALRIAQEIPRDASRELLAAAASFVARGRHWEAGRMAERAGDGSLSARYFRRAGSLIDVGRVEESAGRPHEAGIAYEQALASAGNPVEAATAQLALGRLLARLGRHQDAARSLQQAMRVPACRLAAGRALTAELVALGFRVAATEIVARLRREAPELPDSPDEIAALDAADVAASASTVGQLATNQGPLRQRFKVLHSLGAGATSQVYLAEDTLLGHPVALKLLSVGAGARGAERHAYLSFAREAEAAGRLRHPNIVALHDADPAMGLFVFELMPGGTLAERCAREGALPLVAVRRLALDLLSGLASAHQAGIIHRDVKPANVLFDAAGNAKLGDFGAAHLVDFGQTQTGGLLGTVAYMSPEQITGAPIGPQADLYSLGVLLFEAMTGGLPFPGPDIVAQHLGSEPTTPSSRRPGLDAAHDAVLHRALRKAPAERWNSAADMSTAIRSWPVVDPTLPVSPLVTPESEPAEIEIPASVPDVPLGRSPSGLLWRREHPRLGRSVLVEIRSEAVEGEALVALQTLAAVGGPHVQRVLGLSDDGREVTYELVEGRDFDLADFTDLADLAPSTLHALATAEQALSSAGQIGPKPRRVVLTPGGPVYLVVEPLDDDSPLHLLFFFSSFFPRVLLPGSRCWPPLAFFFPGLLGLGHRNGRGRSGVSRLVAKHQVAESVKRVEVAHQRRRPSRRLLSLALRNIHAEHVDSPHVTHAGRQFRRFRLVHPLGVDERQRQLHGPALVLVVVLVQGAVDDDLGVDLRVPRIGLFLRVDRVLVLAVLGQVGVEHVAVRGDLKLDVGLAVPVGVDHQLDRFLGPQLVVALCQVRPDVGVGVFEGDVQELVVPQEFRLGVLVGGLPFIVLTNGPVEGASFHAGSSNLPSILIGFDIRRATMRLRALSGFATTLTGIVAASTRLSPSLAPLLTVKRVGPRQRPTYTITDSCVQVAGSVMVCWSRMISPGFHWLTAYLPPTGPWSALMKPWWFGPSMCVKTRQPSPGDATNFQ